MGILVFNIDRDGKINSNDENIVYGILEKEIIIGYGSIGTLISRIMVHIEYRNIKAR